MNENLIAEAAQWIARNVELFFFDGETLEITLRGNATKTIVACLEEQEGDSECQMSEPE